MRYIISGLMAVFIMSCGVKDPSKEVLAIVSGEKITLGDLEEKNSALKKQLFKLEETTYRYKELYLNDMIETRLMEVEAKKRGVKVAELIRKEVKDKITAVTDKEVKDFGKGKKIPKEQMEKLKERIKQYLASQRESEVRKNFTQTLKEKYKVIIKLTKPKKEKVKVEISKDDPTRGDKNAKVTIVEFSNFACGYCKRASDDVSKIFKEYGNKVRFVFKHFPFGQRIHRASQASMCAHEQGKFFEYHDLLFESNRAFSDKDLKKYAVEVKADAKKFDKCLESGKYKAKIDKDIADAKKYGITGTPTFFINGEMIVGAVPYSELKRMIDDAMKG